MKIGVPVSGLLFWAVCSVAVAMSPGHGKLHVSEAWARELPPVSPNGAVYLVIENKGDEPDRLVGASTPAAERAEIHTHDMTDGVMKMRKLERGLAVPGQGNVELVPGGDHLMLMKLNEPLSTGRRFQVTLEFEHAGKVTVEVEVLSMDAAAKMKTGGHSGHGKKTGMSHGSAAKHGTASQ